MVFRNGVAPEGSGGMAGAFATVFLVRHGESTLNTREESGGDGGLTVRGRYQAIRVAECLATVAADRLVTSPARRAFETATIIGERLALRPEVDPDLVELQIGELEFIPRGSMRQELSTRVTDAWLAGDEDCEFRGGESLRTAQSRLDRAIARALRGEAGTRCILVGHGGLFAIPLQFLCPDARPELLRLHPPLASVSVLRLSPLSRRGELSRWADTSHLIDLI